MLGKVLGNGRIFPFLEASLVGVDPVIFLEDLNCIVTKTSYDLSTAQVVGHAVEMLVYDDVVVDIHPLRDDFCEDVTMGCERASGGTVERFKLASSRAREFLEWSAIKLVEQCQNGVI